MAAASDTFGVTMDAWDDIEPIFNSAQEDAVVQIAYSNKCTAGMRTQIQ